MSRWLSLSRVATNAQFCSHNFGLTQPKTSSQREFYDWSLAEPSLLSRSAPWFSRKKNGSSDTGSFDWNGWNSIFTEFRVISLEHCRVYVSRKALFSSFESFFEMRDARWYLSDIIKLLILAISEGLRNVSSESVTKFLILIYKY